MKLRNTLLARFFACVVIAFSALALSACGESETEESIRVITEGLTEQLEEPKNIDDDFIEDVEAMGMADFAALEDIGIPLEDFIPAMYEGYDYTMGEVAVDGNAASVPVSITMKNVSAFLASLTELSDGLATNPNVPTGSQEEFYAWYAGEVMRILDETPVVASEEFSFELTCDEDGVWSPTDESLLKLHNPQS